MDHVMYPSLALLDSQVPPLGLRHQMGLRYALCDVFGQHYMSVLIFVIVIFVRIVDLLVRHGGSRIEALKHSDRENNHFV